MGSANGTNDCRLAASSRASQGQGSTLIRGFIKVYSAGALGTILKELVPRFARASGTEISLSYDRSGLVKTRILDGAVVDVVITTRDGIDELARHGKIVPDSVCAVACSRIGVAVRAGAAKPDLSSVASFKRALLNARSIAYADPATGSPSGNHFIRVLQQLGIASQVAAKSKLIGAGEGTVVVVCEAVADGTAEIGIQQIAEILAVPGVELAGLLPAELQQTTVFSAAIGLGAGDPERARRFIDFITSDGSTQVVTEKGMERAI